MSEVQFLKTFDKAGKSTFELRDYQYDAYEALQVAGKRRHVWVWHRRAGKDMAALRLLAERAFREPGNYWLVYPQFDQARRAIWVGIDNGGNNIIDACFPESIVTRKLDQQMYLEIRTECGGMSTFNVIGSDNYDSLVGSNPKGIVVSEWALCQPEVWDFLRPILLANGGWAVFIYTPRGHNHGYTLYKQALQFPDTWYVSLKTVDDTYKLVDGVRVPIMDADELEEERQTMPESRFMQEYYCDFNADLDDAYFAGGLKALYERGSIEDHFVYDPNLPVYTAWDLGYNDATAIWFWQVQKGNPVMIHYYEDTKVNLNMVVQMLEGLSSGRGWRFRKHFFPHDGAVHEWVTGQTRLNAALAMGLPVEPLKRVKKTEGIDLAQRVLLRTSFNSVTCARGLEALANYKADARSVEDGKGRPAKSKWNHGADAFQYFAQALEKSLKSQTPLKNLPRRCKVE
jgi:phage terminase large subunit